MVLRARASALQVLGDRAGASAAMKRSLAILNDYDGMMTAARIELMQGNLDAADSMVNAALKFRPGDVDARLLKIDLAMRKQAPAKAQPMAEKLVADNPNSVSALLMRIKVYLATGRADKAGPDIDRILAQMPNMAMARYFKAIQLARHNDIKGAWDVAHSLPREYLEGDPTVAVNVANIAVAAGYLDSGASILNVVVQHFPWLLEARLQLVDLRLRQNSLQYAVNALAIVRDSKDPRVAALFARIALMKRDNLGAQKFIRQAIEAGGGEELRMLDKDVALKSLRDYLALHPDNKLVKKQYAILLLGFGELAKAKAVYEQVVREDPADAVALNNLSWLVVKDNPGRALALAQRAVQADPRSANNLDTLGCMQMNRSDARGAVESLQRAHDMAPDNAEIFYHLALAHEASGNGAESQAILQTLVKRGGFNSLEAAKTLLASKLKLAEQTQVGR
jgi:tetratricopeptide (TPR) repeat protein